MNEMNLRPPMHRKLVFTFLSARLSIALIATVAVVGDAFAQFGGGLGTSEVVVSDQEPSRTSKRLGPLVDVITSTIQPSTWADKGGNAEIKAVDDWGLIVVSQTDSSHRQIETLLKVMR